jgi:hypothetical protein
MLDNWPKSGYNIASNFRYDRPTLGVCFDIGKTGSGRYGLKCWEILWKAIDLRLIAGSSLFEGFVLESENVYCLAIQNGDAWRLEEVMRALETNADFRQVCANPHFYQGENVFHEQLLDAGHVNDAGTIIGLSINARPAFIHVRNERKITAPPEAKPAEIRPVSCPVRELSPRAVPSAIARSSLKKWWHVWKL